jgi:hypothetical protein
MRCTNLSDDEVSPLIGICTGIQFAMFLEKQRHRICVLDNHAPQLRDLAQRISEGEKQLGPEYLALVDALREIDLNSKDGQEILSIFDKLDNYCPH